MERINSDEAGGSYFALRRLWLLARGKKAERSEADWREAHFPGYFIFLISYLFAANIISDCDIGVDDIPWLVALAFATWLGWLLILYLNSLAAGLCRRVGLFTDLPPSRIQSVLIGLLTSVFAADLLLAPWCIRWIGAFWLLAVASNLAAAFVLALFPPGPDVA